MICPKSGNILAKSNETHTLIQNKIVVVFAGYANELQSYPCGSTSHDTTAFVFALSYFDDTSTPPAPVPRTRLKEVGFWEIKKMSLPAYKREL